MRSVCRRSIMTMSQSLEALAHVVEHLDAEPLDRGGHQGRRRRPRARARPSR